MQLAAGSAKTQAVLYREMLEEAELAEELGFDSVWIAEHHFAEDGMCPSPLIAASAIAARTSTIRIGTAMLLLPLYRPVQVAEDVAVLDNICGGRLILGVGTGYRPEEFGGRGEARKGRGRRMEEQIRILLEAWTRDSFSFSGADYQVPEISVAPKPFQKPHPPIWMGASTGAGLLRAARWAESIVASSRHHLNDVKSHFARYRDHLRELGKAPKHCAVIREVYVAETQARAEEEARGPIMQVNAALFGKYAGVQPTTDDQGRRVADAASMTWEGYRERLMVGTPDHVIGEIEKYQREAGMDYLIATMDFPAADRNHTLKSMRLFAREVMPHFRK